MAYSQNGLSATNVGPLVGFGTTSGSGTPSGRLWVYKTTDAIGTVQSPGYFSNGQTLGMEQGDLVMVVVTTTPQIYFCIVASASTVNNSVNLGSTNTPTVQ